MKPFLLVLGLVAVAGLGVWFGRSGSGPGPNPVAPAPAPASSAHAGETAQLESQAAGRTAIADPAAKSGAGPANGAIDPAAPQQIDPTAIPGAVDGAIPIESDSAGGASPYAAKYAGMTKDELRSAYDSLKQLYDEQTAGTLEKDRQLPADALAQFANELAWLKQEAYGG